MKILFVATVMGHFKSFHQPYMKWFQDQGWEVHVAANMDIDIEYYDRKYILPIERSPYSKSNIKAYKQLKDILKKERYDLLHCHTPMGGVLARLAACMTKDLDTKVIYTAHGFHFYKGAPFINWLVYYPVERWLAHCTDVLITINKEDFQRAQSFKAKKVEYVPGVGVDVSKFKRKVDREAKRIELGLQKRQTVILSVGELSSRKNHEIVIKALGKLKDTQITYVICGTGSEINHLRELANNLNVNVMFLGYRDDIFEIGHAADIFLLPSLQEGLPVALMEAMAEGLPVICSKIRGNIDLIDDSKGGYLVNPKDVDGFAEAIKKLAMDKDSRFLMGKNNEVVIKKFDIKNVKPIMIEIYSSQFREKN